MNFDYGKDAAYVWAALGAAGVILAWMILDSLLRAAFWRKRAALRDDRS